MLYIYSIKNISALIYSTDIIDTIKVIERRNFNNNK